MLLDEYMRVLGLTEDKQLSILMGYGSPSTITKWRSNGEIPAAAEKKLKKILADRGIEDIGRSSKGMDDYVFIPRYDVQASAGGGSIVQSEQVVDHLAFKREWVHNALGIPVESLALIDVRGDSMEPTLSNGDLILIDLRTHHVDADSIYVLRLNGSLLVKRVQRNFDGTIEITSDNPRYKPSVLKNEEINTLGLIGRVVWCGRRM